MAVISKPIVMPRISLIRLWEWAGYPVHDVVGVNQFWQTQNAEQFLERHIFTDLESRGLARDGSPTAELRGTLEVLAKAEAECHGWVGDLRTGQNGGVLCAEYRGQAVRLVRDDDTVRIDPIPVGEVAEHTVLALPAVPPAMMESFLVEVPSEGGGEDGPYEVQVKKARTQPSEQARLKQLQRGPHTGVHELYVVARANGEERTSESLTVLDVKDSGRVIVTHTVDRGEKMLRCQSGSFETLVHEIQSHWQALARTITPTR